MEKNRFFPEINGNFAFGCMRLPMNGNNVDYEEFTKMADEFIDRGFNYFDTAHGYLGGKSETAIRDCVSKRYDRSRFLLTDKLTDPYFNRQEDIRPFFEKQLELCGVDYFDFYLMHAQDTRTYKKFRRCNAYETAFELKKEGKIRHVGLSFHDKEDVLERILTDYPEIEVVQIQLNYLDWVDISIDSKNVYEVCEKFGKPVFVMEPVKGGSLVNLPEDAKKALDDVGSGSYASYAIRFAAGFKNICAVLSGMSSLDQMKDNLSHMENYRPLDEREMAAIEKVREVFSGLNMIKCTNCRYCVEGCPKNILIPDLFACYNTSKFFSAWNQEHYYRCVLTARNGKASDCIRCGRCEKSCPQHLEIRQLLKDVAEEFENR